MRGWAMLPAVIWLLIQLAMTGVAAAPSQALAGPSSGDELGWQALGLQHIAICSPDGTVTLDAGSSSQSNSPGASHCEWCQAFGSLTLPPVPATAAAAEFFSLPFRYQLAAIRAVPKTGAQTGFFSRAPPA